MTTAARIRQISVEKEPSRNCMPSGMVNSFTLESKINESRKLFQLPMKQSRPATISDDTDIGKITLKKILI